MASSNSAATAASQPLILDLLLLLNCSSQAGRGA